MSKVDFKYKDGVSLEEIAEVDAAYEETVKPIKSNFYYLLAFHTLVAIFLTGLALSGYSLIGYLGLMFTTVMLTTIACCNTNCALINISKVFYIVVRDIDYEDKQYAQQKKVMKICLALAWVGVVVTFIGIVLPYIA